VAKRTMKATPGDHGGPGFDPLSYSPRPNWDPPPQEDEKDSVGKAIAGFLFGAAVWAVTRLMEDDSQDS